MSNKTNQPKKIEIDQETLNLLSYVERRLEDLQEEYKEVHAKLESLNAVNNIAVNHIIALSAKHEVLLDIQSRIRYGGYSAKDLLEDYTREITQRAFNILSRSTDPVSNFREDVLLAEKAAWLDTFKMYTTK